MDVEFAMFAREIMRRSPLYADLCAAIADTPDVLALLDAADVSHRRPVQLLAALHYQVLSDGTHPLRSQYPSTGGQPGPDLVPTALAACRDDADALRHLIAHRNVQTNEVGRSPIIMIGLSHLSPGEPVDLVDLGTSAGLNLYADRYRTTCVDPDGNTLATWGDTDPSLSCVIRSAGFQMPQLVTIRGRRGLDPDPIRSDDHDTLRWLDACIWPDQSERRDRVRAAIATAQSAPPAIDTAHLPGGIDATISAAHTGARTALVTSWVLAYLAPEDRIATIETFTRAIADDDAVALLLESPQECPDLPWPDSASGSRRTEMLAGRRTPSGHVAWEHLGTAHPHGIWFLPL